MPNNTRDLALQTLLLMVAATLLFMGVAGFIFGMGSLHALFAVTLVPDAALITLLLGLGLLAALQYWQRLRRLSACILMGALVYTLVHNQLAGEQAGSWLTGQLRISSIAAIMLFAVALCLFLGFATCRRRWAWLMTGMALWLLAAILTSRLWSGAEVESPLFSSSPVAVLVFIVLTGSAFVAIGVRRQPTRIDPGRWAVVAGLVGVAISSAVWLLLSVQQHASTHQQAKYLLDNVQLNVEQAIYTRLQQMQRMAERLETLSGGVEIKLLAIDAQNYLDDIPSLKGIVLLNEENQHLWSIVRAAHYQTWLQQHVTDPQASNWLNTPTGEPRIMISDVGYPQPMLLAHISVASGQQLLAMFDITELLNDELMMALGPFEVRVSLGNEPLITLTPAGLTADPILAFDVALITQQASLPNGGGNLTLNAYPGAHYNWYLMGFMPVLVAMGGLLLTWLLAFSLGLMGVSFARTRELSLAQLSLAESEQRYRSLFTHHPDAVFSLDVEGCFVTANESCEAITGYVHDDILGQHFTHFINAEDLERVGQHFYSAMQGMITRFDLSINNRNGGQRLLDIIVLPVHINHNVVGIHGIAQDVTLSRAQQTQLRTLERSVEASVNGVLIADANMPDMPIVYANRAFTDMTGYAQEEVIGHNCRILQGRDSDPEAVAKIRRRLGEMRDVHVTLCNYRKDGTLFWNDLYISPVRNQEGLVTHFVGVQHDISKHKAYEAQLAYQATHDALTRLPNRALFEDKLLAQFTLSQQSDRRLAVLFVDLDDFKPINDNLGHALGDRLLVEVAKRLLASVGSNDTVARLGGDEFVILLVDIQSEAQTEELVEGMLATLARPYCLEGHELHISASIGIALSHGAILQPQMLIQQADMAMYKAKQLGRNAYEWFCQSFTDSVSERMVLRNDLQEAIEQDAFDLHYQPLIDQQGQLAGVEALIRWHHPTKGWISPARFIPLAETTGQIIPISEWVLKRACSDMQALTHSGMGTLQVAVNLSPLQFQRSNFLATLRQTLLTTGLAPAQLSLELTEGILMENTEAAIATLHVLRNMQISVSIDDFGTGYSSLSYLKLLPISTVKIDRSFIQELTRSSGDAAIVQGIISMAHHLGLKVVAEGVETDEQYQRLLSYQCDIFQGFGLAKPMPIDALKRFMASSKVDSPQGINY